MNCEGKEAANSKREAVNVGFPEKVDAGQLGKQMRGWWRFAIPDAELPQNTRKRKGVTTDFTDDTDEARPSRSFAFLSVPSVESVVKFLS